MFRRQNVLCICPLVLLTAGGCIWKGGVTIDALLVDRRDNDGGVVIKWRLENDGPGPIWVPVAWKGDPGALPAVVLVPGGDIVLVYAEFDGLRLDPPPAVELQKVAPHSSLSGAVRLCSPIATSLWVESGYARDDAGVFERTTHVSNIRGIQIVVQYFLCDPTAAEPESKWTWENDSVRGAVLRGIIDGRQRLLEPSYACKAGYRMAMSRRCDISLPLEWGVFLPMDHEREDIERTRKAFFGPVD